MRISDWSSDVCSSDLHAHIHKRINAHSVHSLLINAMKCYLCICHVKAGIPAQHLRFKPNKSKNYTVHNARANLQPAQARSEAWSCEKSRWKMELIEARQKTRKRGAVCVIIAY